jgi:NDP-sugar pyrophosphorylase family protein
MRDLLGPVPKILAPLGTRTLLDIYLAWFRVEGVSRCFLASGHGADRIETALRQMSPAGTMGIETTLLREPEELGTGGAIAFAFRALEDDRAIVMNGDTLFRIGLVGLVEAHLDREAETTVTVREVADRRRFGSLDRTTDGRITCFAEKGREGPGPVNAGVYVLEREMIEDVTAPPPVSFEYEVLPARLEGRIYAYIAEGLYLDTGTPESYKEALTLSQSL